MSLRADIHDALDAELPPAPALENKVAAHLREGGKDRKFVVYRARRTRALRWPLHLVAAALIVALIGGLIAGGKLLRDLNRQSQVDQAVLHALESRPMQLPTLLPGAQCPVTRPDPNGAIGTGPVYLLTNGIQSVSASGANWWRARLEYESNAPGLVLIRAVDINAIDTKGGQPVWFAQPTDVTSAVIAVGPVLEIDRGPGGTVEWHPEAAFYGPVSGKQPLELMYMLGIAYQRNCVGWQFDGPAGFSEHIVTSAASS